MYLLRYLLFCSKTNTNPIFIYGWKKLLVNLGQTNTVIDFWSLHCIVAVYLSPVIFSPLLHNTHWLSGGYTLVNMTKITNFSTFLQNLKLTRLIHSNKHNFRVSNTIKSWVKTWVYLQVFLIQISKFSLFTYVYKIK